MIGYKILHIQAFIIQQLTEIYTKINLLVVLMYSLNTYLDNTLSIGIKSHT